MKQRKDERRRGIRPAARAGALVAVLAQLAACSFFADPPPVAAPASAPVAAEAAAPAPVKLIWATPMSKPARIPTVSGDAAAERTWLPARPRIVGSLAWPVQGPIRRGFGAQPNGARSDGLDIAAGEGTLVVAADEGIVTYAGSELQGYGNMLLIAHPDGYTTVYAHNQSLLVAMGAEVRRGQPIAMVGRTGDVDDPQLHFQLRAGDRPVDPTAYLETGRTMVASLATGEPTTRIGE